MSAQGVDVLAVMDQCCAGLHSVASNCRTDLSNPMRERAEAMDSARAAVAELIDAAQCAMTNPKGLNRLGVAIARARGVA